MSVLNRKLFAPVRMHTGGVPPHAPEGHKHSYDFDLSDQQVVERINTQQTNLTELKKETGMLTGIMEGFGQATDEEGTIDPETLAEKIYPGKTKEEYEAEARSLYSTDLSAERAEVERQKQEDIVAGMIGFGARLATGRGNALDVLGQAAQQTLPEFMAARRATRKDVIALKSKEKEAKKAISTYVMTQQQENEAKRAKLMIDAVFKNLDFGQDQAKAERLHNWDMEKTIVPVKNLATGNNAEITLRQYTDDMKLPPNERQFMKATDYEKPFEVYDKMWGVDRMFNNYEEFATQNKLSPTRFEGAHANDDPLKVKARKVGNFTHPNTVKYGKMMIQEMTDGTYMIPQLKEDGSVVLQANGHPVMIPLGTGIEDLVVGKDVELTAADLMPPKVLNEQLATILLYDRNIRSINKVISNLADDKTRAGIVGQLKEMIQIGRGMITDVLDADAQGEIFDSAVRDFSMMGGETPADTDAIKALFDPSDPRSAQFFGDFDPALAENRTRVNAIAYAVARSRKSSGRLNLDDIKKAYESLKVTGFTDARTAITQLFTIRDELATANTDMKMLFEHNGGQYPDAYTGVKNPVDDKDLPKLYYNEDGTIKTIIFPGELK